jgi:hypothetical protein
MKVLYCQRFSDVVTRLLQAGQPLLQRFKKHTRPNEFEFTARSAEQPLRFGGRTDPTVRTVQQFVEIVLGQLQRIEHRTREQPVEQDELDDPVGVQHTAIRAQVGVMRARRAQHRHPRRRGRAVAHP